MILGVGIDLVEIARIERAVGRHGGRFLKRIYTETEIAYCESMKRTPQHLAGRWAAKEAAAKALGTGIFGAVRFRDIEVTNDARGKPLLTLTGRAAEVAESLGARRCHVSIAHTDTNATAVVVIEGIEGGAAGGNAGEAAKPGGPDVHDGSRPKVRLLRRPGLP